MKGDKTYAYTPRQRRRATFSGMAVGAIGLAITVDYVVTYWGDLVSAGLVLWVFLGLGPLLLTVLIFGLSRGRTRIDGRGLHADSLWRHWHVHWTDITAIESRWEDNRGGVRVSDNRITRIWITRANGKPFKLPVPFDSEQMTQDPEFDVKLDEITQAWRHGRKAHA